MLASPAASDRGLVAVAEDLRYANAPGDLEEAIASLLDDYEATGEQRMRGVTAAEREALERSHRCWVAYSFSALVEGIPVEEQCRRLEELSAVLDETAWRSVRIDAGRSREETAQALLTAAEGVLSAGVA